MHVTVFSTRPYDQAFLDAANAQACHQLTYLDSRLTTRTAAAASGATAVCAFVNDVLDDAALRELAGLGVRLVALRCAGFNNVDMPAAARLKIAVARVPDYSPYAVAEHAATLMMALNRKIHRAYARVREGNFALDGLMGFDLHGRVVGVVGTGKIGTAFSRIMQGFGCRILANDPFPNPDCAQMGVRYVGLDELFASVDILSLHCPLTPDTMHLVNESTLALMRQGVMVVNTSRGAVIDTRAIIAGLKSGRVGSLGIDVYEEETGLFFRNLSDKVIQDDVFARLLTFPNVLVTGHQGFFTSDALANIARTTIDNITAFETTGHALHELPRTGPPGT